MIHDRGVADETTNPDPALTTVCRLCFAIVELSDEQDHADWHEHLRAALILAGARAPGVDPQDVRRL